MIIQPQKNDESNYLLLRVFELILRCYILDQKLKHEIIVRIQIESYEMIPASRKILVYQKAEEKNLFIIVILYGVCKF